VWYSSLNFNDDSNKVTKTDLNKIVFLIFAGLSSQIKFNIIFSISFKKSSPGEGKIVLFKEKTEGGLNLTNIKIYAKSVKFQWIYKLYNEDYNAFWKHLSWDDNT
jgi:hypothetical protein